MLTIPCPFCGERDEAEFRYGGEAIQEIPPAEASDAEWSDYLFNRDNPKGLVHERWCHSFGCNQWFQVVRDTVTHRIHAVYRIGEPRPEADDDRDEAVASSESPQPGSARGHPSQESL